MQPGPTEISERTSHSQPSTPLPNHQHGFVEPDAVPGPLPRSADSDDAESVKPSSVSSGQLSSRLSGALESDLRLRGVKSQPRVGSGPRNRVEEYEHANSSRRWSRDHGITVSGSQRRRSETGNSPGLLDLPNEILTHVLSHLPPTAMSSAALVSHRLHDLVTSPHAWRIAFSRNFPGSETLGRFTESNDGGAMSYARRSFTRLTSLASWRSEYIIRTRLLRSLARGKPSESLLPGLRGNSRSANSGSAQLTYYSNLITLVDKLHANFGTGLNKRVPKFIHGASEVGCASSSGPVNQSKVDAWGSSDPQSFVQFDFRFPGDVQYGLGPGEIVGVPNSMDVSQTLGMIVGEGSPGGSVYFRHSQEHRGRFLARSLAHSFPELGIPKVNQARESMCSVWIAKSTEIGELSDGLVGMLSGSSLGIVTAYSTGTDGLTGRRLERGEVTARWVLSPGVPIVALKVDEKYSLRRRGQRRIWAVALNALGELFYLNEMPVWGSTSAQKTTSVEELDILAWNTGRTVYWEMVECTRRRAAEDPYRPPDVDTTQSPRSSCIKMALSSASLAAETKELEQFMSEQPRHFQSACQGWDMRRRIEVDFAGDDEQGAGESVVVFECGFIKDTQSTGRRYTRCGRRADTDTNLEATGIEHSFQHATASASHANETDSSKTDPNSTPEQWLVSDLSFGPGTFEVLTSAIDISTYALLTVDEDPLLSLSASHSSSPWSTPTEETPQAASPTDVPGQRARFAAVGTSHGQIIIWNMRGPQAANSSVPNQLSPVRVIQTDSPRISCLALSALYLVHGGNDGLVQAWDPLGSSTQPIRTLNARYSSRVRNLILQTEATEWGTSANLYAAGAICLDPDPTSLRGMVSLGTNLRYWSYASSAVDELKRNKRRLRRSARGSNQHSDSRFTASSRGALKSHIEIEQREIEREKKEIRKEQARLEARFGVGLLGPGATEEEMLAYATLLSQEETERSQEEAERSEEEHRPQSSRTRDAPSSPSISTVAEAEDPDAFEREIEEAIRLSLQEDEPLYSSSPDIPIRYAKSKAKARSPRSSPPGAAAESSRAAELDDLDFALQLSLAEEQSRFDAEKLETVEEFPALSPSSSNGSGSSKGKGRGKGKGKAKGSGGW